MGFPNNIFSRPRMMEGLRHLVISSIFLLLISQANCGTLRINDNALHLEPWIQTKSVEERLIPALDSIHQMRYDPSIGTLALLSLRESSQNVAHQCTESGFFPITGSCRDFYQCVRGREPGTYSIHLYSCPVGTLFDKSRDSCALPHVTMDTPDCVNREAFRSPLNSNLPTDISSLVGIPLKRSKRVAAMTLLTGLIAAGTLVIAANDMLNTGLTNFNTGLSMSKGSKGSVVDLKGLEDKLTGIEGKLNGISLSVLESRVENRIGTKVTQGLIVDALNKNQRDFEVTQSLIDRGFIENRIRTAAIQGLIVQGNNNNEANFAKVQVSIGKLKEFINDEIMEAKASIKKGFESVSTSIDQSRIEPLVSSLLTAIKGFHERLTHLQSLPEKNQKDEIEKSGGYLEYLESSTLQDTLQDVLQQNFAIPDSESDLTAIFVLDLLVHGLQVHSRMLFAVVSSNVYLAAEALDARKLEEFNTHMLRIQSALARVKLNLGYNDQSGLLTKVRETLTKVENLPFASSIQGITQLLSQKGSDIDQIESDIGELVLDNTELSEAGTITGKPDFTSSSVSAPVGPWESGKQVSYAVQFVSERGLSQIGPWSTSYTITDKANPTLRLTRVEAGLVRLIYRRFNHETPELVAIMEDNEQTLFRDIGRDIINAAARPNEDLAVKEMRILLEDMSSDINTSLEDKMTALHYAAKHGNVKVMEILIEKGANVHTKAFDNQEAIHFAALFGAEEGVEFLISKEARVNAQTKLLGLAPLHIAVANSHVDASRALIDNGAFINIKDNNGLTPLHISVAGNGDAIDVLIENPDLDINAVAEDGLTPLHYAARSSSKVFLEKLMLDANIDVNAKSKSLLTPIHLAAMGGNTDIIAGLVRHGAKVASTDAYGSTPLHYAAFYGNKRAVLMLMQLDESLKDIKNDADKTALDFARENQREEIISIFGDNEENLIEIMSEEFGEESTIPEADPSNRSIPDQTTTNSCSSDAVEQMAIGSEETCAHIGHVETYVNLVLSMIPLQKYYANQPEFSEIFGAYDNDLLAAQWHAKAWRNGDSIVKGIGTTFELARKFELEFSRKNKINKLRVKRIKANADQEKLIKEIQAEIKNLEEQLQNATEAMENVQMEVVLVFFRNMISGYEIQIKEKKRMLQEDFTLIPELEELAAFMEFVRSDSLKIQEVAITTRGKIEVFRDHLELDKSAFVRHHHVAGDALTKLEEETIRNNELLAQYKEKGKELEAKIEEERKQVSAHFEKINESHRQLRDMRRDLIKKISSTNTWKIVGIILTPLIVGIPILINANKEQKEAYKLLESSVEANKAEVDLLLNQIKYKYAEMDTFRAIIANSENNSENVRNEMNDFITLNSDLETLSSETDKLIEAIGKAIVGVKLIKDVFDDVTKKLGEMIDLAKTAKTEAERLNARYFIYTELSLLECNWKDIYINVMNLDTCTKNFEVLY